jgi:hypothetical protein
MFVLLTILHLQKVVEIQEHTEVQTQEAIRLVVQQAHDQQKVQVLLDHQFARLQVLTEAAADRQFDLHQVLAPEVLAAVVQAEALEDQAEAAGANKSTKKINQ